MDESQAPRDDERCEEIEKRLEGEPLSPGQKDDLVREIVERLRWARGITGYWRPRLKIRWVDLLGTLGHGSPLALEALAEMVEDRDAYEDGAYDTWVERVSDHALGALKRIGAPAVPVLVRLFESRTPQIRRDAARLIANLGPAAAEATAALRILARDPDGDVRGMAGSALAAIWEGDESRWASIEQLLADPVTRRAGMGAIARLPRAERLGLIDLLIGLLSDPDPGVRKSAVSQLGTFREAADRVVGPLITCLETDPSKNVRKDTMLVVRDMGLSDPRVADALVRALVRNETPFALWSIYGWEGRPASLLAPHIPELLARFNDPDNSLAAEMALIFIATRRSRLSPLHLEGAGADGTRGAYGPDRSGEVDAAPQ